MDNSFNRGPDYIPQNGGHQRYIEEQHIRQRPYESSSSKQERKKSNSLMKKIKKCGVIALSSIAIGGTLFGLKKADNANDSKAFAHAQETNIENSCLANLDNVECKCNLGEYSINFEENGVKYKLIVDAVDLDEEGPQNYNGGICKATATYEVNGKEYVKTFESKDTEEKNHSWQDGVSINDALKQVGYDPAQNSDESVIE